MAESEIIDYFRAAGQKNATDYASFLGAGAYRHYRPVIIDSLVQRGEFLTSYTPYHFRGQQTLFDGFPFLDSRRRAPARRR